MNETGRDFEKIAPYYDLLLKTILLVAGGEGRFRKK
jgi:hypothetical protein